jgi:glycosyltransferase EpsE
MFIKNNTLLFGWKIMNNNPLISILMTVYNNESTITQSLNSIKKQTYTNWELIIINDGSKDNTLKLIKNFKSEVNNQVTIINNEINLGINLSLNLGLDHIKGDYVARQDGDDVSTNNRLEKQFNFLINNNNFDFVCSLVQIFDSQIVINKDLPIAPQKKDFIHGLPFVNATALSRAKLVKKVKGYSESKIFKKRFEDYDFWLRSYSFGFRGYNLQEVLYNIQVDKSVKIKKIFYYHRFIESYMKLKVILIFKLNPLLIFYCLTPFIKIIIPVKLKIYLKSLHLLFRN